MIPYLEKLGVGGTAAVIIIAIVVLSSLISSSKIVFGVIKNFTLSIIDSYKRRKEYDSTIEKHTGSINKLIEDQHQTRDITLQNSEAITKLIESHESYINQQRQYDVEMRSNVDSLHDTVNAISEVVVDSQIDLWKTTINDFASAIANGRRYTKTQYHNVMSIYNKYTEVLRLKNLTDDDVKYSYAIIVEGYKNSCINHTFVKDGLDAEDLNSTNNFDYRNFDVSN